jgi:rod shape-determining protein MreC
LVIVPSSLSLLGYTDILRSTVKTLSIPFEWCGNLFGNALSGFVSTFTGYDELVAENEALRAQLEAASKAEYQNALIQSENDWLKKYLDVKQDFPSLLLCDATIISREAGNYSTVLTLNRGSIHGIKKNMPVITELGVLGYVSETGPSWCRVVSIVETASSVGAYTDRNHTLGVVVGDTLLREDAFCKMTYIDATADIKVGDKVYTSGGSIYPSDLLIGEVSAIVADEYTRTLVAHVKPAVNFETIMRTTRLMIITGYDMGGEAK